MNMFVDTPPLELIQPKFDSMVEIISLVCCLTQTVKGPMNLIGLPGF